MSKLISIEVAYARPDEQLILKLDVDSDISVEEAIMQSGILARFPDIDLTLNKVGIFGKLTTLMHKHLRQGDRIEIYRTLLADPKESRKKRAAKAKESA